MCGKAEESVAFIIAASLTVDMKSRFPQDLSETPVKEVVRIAMDKLMDKSFGRQEEIRNVAAKIKWYNRRRLNKHIGKNKIPRQDMILAGCDEVQD